MKKFAKIKAVAEKRKGGEKALKALLPPVLSKAKLAKKGDDRFLAMMCKAVNQAGFNWTVIENKWPQFEEAYYGFDLNKLLSLSADDWDAYTKDVRVVRSRQKIYAMARNVQFVAEAAAQHGSFAKFIAQWPGTDQIGLMAYLKKHGSRLGGQTAQWFMRYVGKDCFIITPDVCRVINDAGYDIAENPTSKRDLQLVQEAFNHWHEETGLPFAHLSKIAAYSSGSNYDNQGIAEEMQKLSATV